MNIPRKALLLLFVCVIAGCHGGKPAGSADTSPGSALPAYDSSTATARVFGSIHFDGKAPVMAPVDPSGSRYCVQNTKGTTEQTVLVTKDHKLQNVIVYVRTGFEGRSYATPSEPVVLDQQHCIYVPRVVTLMTKQKLNIHNDDPTFHNVHSSGDKNPAFNFAQTTKGEERAVVFEKPEMPIRIGCDLHRWMGAWVGVFDHPFHGTSGSTGDFELKLPPGKYEIVAWHEKYGEKVMTVDVADKAQVPLNFIFSEKDAAK